MKINQRHVNRAGIKQFLLATSAITLFSAGLATSAIAQEAPKPDENVVVVKGFRASLQNAVARKKIANQIVESISAEDIGKLPDASIAESIARLPGLTSQRLSGRAQVITIRGFAPDLSTTLLNGREQVTTGDNRAVEFDQYPSEIMNQVLVYKTPTASLIGQGLAGTVDLRTIRPLDVRERIATIGARVEKSSLGKLNSGTDEYGYRINGTYVNKFLDGKLGVAIAGGYNNTPYEIEEFGAWGYADGPNGTKVIGGVKSFVTSTTLERSGVMGTVDFKPNDNFRTSLDLYYSDFSDHQIKRGLELPLQWSSASLQPVYTTNGNFITSGTYNNVKAVVNNHANEKDAKIYSAGWNGLYDFGNGWKLMGDLSYSKVDRTELILETNAGTGRAGVGATDNMGFVMTDRGVVFTHQLDYSNPALILLTSPQGWGSSGALPYGQDGYYNKRKVSDKINAARVEVSHDFDTGVVSKLQFGINVSNREKSLTPEEYFLSLKAAANANVSVAIPSNLLLEPTALTYLGLGNMVSYDPVALVNSGIYNLVPNGNADVLTKGWTIKEDITTPYVQANIRGSLLGADLTGNIGIQFQAVKQTSTGWAATGAPIITQVQLTKSTDYVDWLPALNLSLKYPNDVFVRFGAAREVARPRLDDMSLSSNFDFSVSKYLAGLSPFGGGGGNPSLEPYRATAYDMSFEKYFGRKGYVALQLYYKDLDSYIYKGDVPYDFTGFPVPASFTALYPNANISYQGYLNVPLNGEGGKLYGWEAAFTLPFEVFTPKLDGFGITGGISETITKVKPDPYSPAEDLPGYSKWVKNATIYYEKNGFSARTSVRYRSSFMGELSGFGGNRTRRRAAPETIIDAQIGYEFQNAPLKGLSVTLQGQNLTDERFMTYDSGLGPQAPIDYQIYGARYSLGVIYKF